ncbi:alpha/beta fold hydrolase [Wenyingzhuangia sp. IMCC45533]
MEKSYFKSNKAKEQILRLYDEKLSELNGKYQSIYINTSYGVTHVLMDHESIKPPMVLIHGLNSCAPYMLEQFEFLQSNYKLIIVDVLGQPNKSDEVRLSKKNNDFGLWIIEIADYLNLKNFSILGYSFGGYIALKTALVADSKRIDQLFLFAPAGLINGSFFKIFKHFLWPMLCYKISKNKQFYDNFSASLGIENHNSLYYEMIFLNYQSDTSMTPIFKNKTLQKINAEAFVFSGSSDFIFPSKKLKNKCKFLPKFTFFKQICKGKHLLSKTQIEQVLRTEVV